MRANRKPLFGACRDWMEDERVWEWMRANDSDRDNNHHFLISPLISASNNSTIQEIENRKQEIEWWTADSDEGLQRISQEPFEFIIPLIPIHLNQPERYKIGNGKGSSL